jgi:quercetin dioxygenase-like cupin family protein
MSDEQTNGASMVVVSPPATRKAVADRFTGDVWVDGITKGAGSGPARIPTVRFSPGAGRAWHCHAYGQTLHMTDGRGLVQSRDGETIAKRPGDMAFTPPGIEHWHGAAPDSFMAHLVLSDSGTDAGVADVEWGDHVSGDEHTPATTGGELERSRR